MKKIVFFRRVSSPGQSFDMQITADAPYREELAEHEYEIIDERASANKLSLEERKEMVLLTSMIRNKEVKIIYAFDRTRLFRDMYDALAFLALCRDYGTKVIYTSTGAQALPTVDSPLLEGMLFLFGDVEGKNIARRSSEAQRRIPRNKFGYIRLENPRWYEKDENIEAQLNDFFLRLQQVTTFEDICSLFSTYRKQFDKEESKLLRIVRDPFYAAYDLYNNSQLLSYVDPYLTLEQFQFIQEEKAELLQRYEQEVLALSAKDKIAPLCGKCGQPLHYRINHSDLTAYYSCSKKHKKISILYTEFIDCVQQVIMYVAQHLNVHALQRETKRVFTELSTQYEAEITQLKLQTDDSLNLLLFDSDYDSQWKETSYGQQVLQNQTEQANIRKKITTAEQHVSNTNVLIQTVRTYFETGVHHHLKTITSMLIGSIIVHDGYIDFDINRFYYIDELKEEFIYEGGILS